MPATDSNTSAPAAPEATPVSPRPSAAIPLASSVPFSTLPPGPEPAISVTPTPVPYDYYGTLSPTLPSSPTLKPLWRDTSAPPDINIPGVQWIEVAAQDNRTMLVAVFRPPGAGPFPAVIVFHGTEGFRLPHVQLAEYFAKNGLIGIAAGWFGGHYDIKRQDTIPTTHPQGDIKWPNGPDIPLRPPHSLAAARNGVALIQAAKTLPGVRASSIGLFGHSRGSREVLRIASISADPGAVVAVAGYISTDMINNLRVPVLILQGTADELIDVKTASDFEKALHASGKTVETFYYEDAPHRIPWLMPWQDDVRQRALAFLTKNLKP